MTDPAAELRQAVDDAHAGRTVPDAARELAALEVALAELEAMWRGLPDRPPAGLSAVPHCLELIRLHGSRMILPLGPSVLLTPWPPEKESTP
jgi:hypothetical protein